MGSFLIAKNFQKLPNGRNAPLLRWICGRLGRIFFLEGLQPSQDRPQSAIFSASDVAFDFGHPSCGRRYHVPEGLVFVGQGSGGVRRLREATMSASYPFERNRVWARLHETRTASEAVTEASGLRVPPGALAGLLGFLLSGCANIQEPPEHRSDTASPAPVLAAAAPETKIPWDDWLKEFGARRPKLVVAGGASLLIASLTAFGVRRILRGTPPGREPRVEEGDPQLSPEFEGRS